VLLSGIARGRMRGGMFANVRLMLVAISASLLAVVCAMALFMGVFAVFSVAHEPFSTLAAAKPPLHIALADDFSVAVADGKPAPFGVRFQLNAPQPAKRPLIVAVPQAVDHAVSPVAALVTNAAANTQPPALPPQDDAQLSPQGNATTAVDTRVSGPANDKANEGANDTKPDSVASNAATAPDSAAAIIKTEPESPPSDSAPAVATAPRRLAPQIRIVSRESDNPASVTTSPAPSLARNKVMKRRKLAAHLRQSHHFRRPRIHQFATEQGGYTTGIVQPNAYQPPSYATGTYAQSSGFMQPGFGYTPAVIRPRATKLRRAASGNSSSR
jgi:hypothetical protein